MFEKRTCMHNGLMNHEYCHYLKYIETAIKNTNILREELRIKLHAKINWDSLILNEENYLVFEYQSEWGCFKKEWEEWVVAKEWDRILEIIKSP